MKHFYRLFAVIGLIVLIFGCSDDELLIPVNIEIKPDTIRMKSDADTATFAVLINSKYDNVRIAWSAKPDTNWIHTDPIYNFGSRFVNVMVKPNKGEERMSSITINPHNSEIYLKVVIIQAANNE
jgi:hypothetical protein